MQPDIGRILISELFRERIDADTSEAGRGIGFEQRAVVTADVDDDIACLQGKTLLDPGGHPSQVLAHRGIGARLVAVVEGVHFSRRHRMQQLDKLTIRAAHQSERRQWRIGLARPRKPAGERLDPEIQYRLEIVVPANPTGCDFLVDRRHRHIPDGRPGLDRMACRPSPSGAVLADEREAAGISQPDITPPPRGSARSLAALAGDRTGCLVHHRRTDESTSMSVEEVRPISEWTQEFGYACRMSRIALDHEDRTATLDGGHHSTQHLEFETLPRRFLRNPERAPSRRSG